MFSSRIIRDGAQELRPVTLDQLGGVRGDAEGFVPLSLGGDTAPPEAESAAPELPEPEPGVPEEEVLARVDAAYQDGYREGKQDAEGELASVSEALAQALLATESVQRSLYHDAEEDLLKLAMMVARKIIVRELSLDPEVLAGMVHGALELVTACDEVVVRLHPEDHRYLAGSDTFQQLSSEKRRVVLKTDQTLERGGCTVETVRGNVDARLESQLDEIYRRFAEERSSRRDEEPDAD